MKEPLRHPLPYCIEKINMEKSWQNFLRLKNVPVYSKRSINLFEDAFINKILKILHYLNAEQDIPYGGDELLFEIMHYDFYQIPAIEIAKLTVEANNKNTMANKHR